jgi:hypothetical protein
MYEKLNSLLTAIILQLNASTFTSCKFHIQLHCPSKFAGLGPESKRQVYVP